MIPALLMQIDPFKSFVPSAGTVDPNADRVSAAAAELMLRAGIGIGDWGLGIRDS